MRGFGKSEGEVFNGLYIGVEPFGGAYLLVLQFLVGQVEEVALRIEARVCGQSLGTDLSCGEILGFAEELLAHVEIVVVRCNDVGGHIVHVVGCGEDGLLSGLEHEEVLVDGELLPGSADVEDTLVVDSDVLDGVVFEDHFFQGRTLVVDTEEGPESVEHGVVAESDLAYGRCVTDIESVAAGTEDAMNVAALDYEFSEVELVGAVVIIDTGVEACNHAVDDADLADLHDSALVVDDAVAACTVEVNVLEVEVSGESGVKNHVGADHWSVAGGIGLTEHAESLGGSDAADRIRGTLCTNINIVAGGHCGLECVRCGNLGEGTGSGACPYGQGSAAGTLEVQHYVVLG